MPFSWARAAARLGPSVRARLRCLRSERTFVDIAGSLSAPRRGGSGRADVPFVAGGAAQPLLLPLPETPQIAADLLGVDLAPRQVHVRGADEPRLFPGWRHPRA